MSALKVANCSGSVGDKDHIPSCDRMSREVLGKEWREKQGRDTEREPEDRLQRSYVNKKQQENRRGKIVEDHQLNILQIKILMKRNNIEDYQGNITILKKRNFIEDHQQNTLQITILIRRSIPKVYHKKQISNTNIQDHRSTTI